MNRTKVPYAEISWSPMTGCGPDFQCYQRCWAKRLIEGRLRGRFGYPDANPFRVVLHEEKLDELRKRKKPARIFVCGKGDLFHRDVPSWFINEVWLAMFNNRQHEYILLTKRVDRLLAWTIGKAKEMGWPQNEVWPPYIALGVSVEDQASAEDRIGKLLATKAMTPIVSIEPMLERIIFAQKAWVEGIDWVICGAESGPGARLCNPIHIYEIWKECQYYKIPYFFKQWPKGFIVTGDFLKVEQTRQYPELWREGVLNLSRLN